MSKLKNMPTPLQMKLQADNLLALLAPLVREMLDDLISDAMEAFRPVLQQVFIANAQGIPARLVIKADGNTITATIEMPEMPALDTEVCRG